MGRPGPRLLALGLHLFSGWNTAAKGIDSSGVRWQKKPSVGEPDVFLGQLVRGTIAWPGSQNRRPQFLLATSQARLRMESAFKITGGGASLVAQCLRICLPMQGTRVRALVWEDPTCRGAAGPVSHNY